MASNGENNVDDVTSPTDDNKQSNDVEGDESDNEYLGANDEDDDEGSCYASTTFVYTSETIAEAEISADGEDNEAEMAALKEVWCGEPIGV